MIWLRELCGKLMRCNQMDDYYQLVHFEMADMIFNKRTNDVDDLVFTFIWNIPFYCVFLLADINGIWFINWTHAMFFPNCKMSFWRRFRNRTGNKIHSNVVDVTTFDGFRFLLFYLISQENIFCSDYFHAYRQTVRLSKDCTDVNGLIIYLTT